MDYRLDDGATASTGDRAYNYYDRQAGTIGAADLGDAEWFDFIQDNGRHVSLNGDRTCSITTAIAKGWVTR